MTNLPPVQELSEDASDLVQWPSPLPAPRCFGMGEGWQPIETAPKDGTKIDVWQRDKRETDIYWSDVQDAWCFDGYYGPEEPCPLAIVPPITPPPSPQGQAMTDQLIRELRGKIDEQAEEIRQLKAMMTTDAPLPTGLPHLSPMEERMLRMMLVRDKVRHSALKTIIPSHVDDADAYLKVYICKLRKKVVRIGMGIENHKGVSYGLVPLDT